MSNVLDRRLCMFQTRQSSLSSSVALTPPSGYQANQFELVVIQPRTQPVYISGDGTAATSTNGRDAYPGECHAYEDPENVRVLEAAASASIWVEWYYRKGSL